MQIAQHMAKLQHDGLIPSPNMLPGGPMGPRGAAMGGPRGVPMRGPGGAPMPMGGPRGPPMGMPRGLPMGVPRGAPMMGPRGAPMMGPRGVPMVGPRGVPIMGPRGPLIRPMVPPQNMGGAAPEKSVFMKKDFPTLGGTKDESDGAADEPMVSPPLKTHRVFYNNPEADPMHASELASEFMEARDVSYVVNMMLKGTATEDPFRKDHYFVNYVAGERGKHARAMCGGIVPPQLMSLTTTPLPRMIHVKKAIEKREVKVRKGLESRSKKWEEEEKVSLRRLGRWVVLQSKYGGALHLSSRGVKSPFPPLSSFFFFSLLISFDFYALPSRPQVLGHVVKKDVSKPRALLSIRTLKQDKDLSSSEEEKLRAEIWKARKLIDKGNTALLDLLELQRLLKDGTTSQEKREKFMRGVATHIGVLEKCLGIERRTVRGEKKEKEKENENEKEDDKKDALEATEGDGSANADVNVERPIVEVEVDLSTLSSALSLPKGMHLLSRCLATGILPHPAALLLLPFALSIVLAEPRGDKTPQSVVEAEERLLRVFDEGLIKIDRPAITGMCLKEIVRKVRK